MPGDNVTLEAELIFPAVMEKGMRFAVREGGSTVGAGVITEVFQEKAWMWFSCFKFIAILFNFLIFFYYKLIYQILITYYNINIKLVEKFQSRICACAFEEGFSRNILSKQPKFYGGKRRQNDGICDPMIISYSALHVKSERIRQLGARMIIAFFIITCNLLADIEG